MASWGDFGALAKVAKSTVLAAQKKIDAVLDIQEGQAASTNATSEKTDGETKEEDETERTDPAKTQPATFNKLQEDFFAAFGLSTAATGSASPEDPAPTSSSRKKSAAGSASKQGWKQGWSLLSNISGASSSTKQEDEDRWENVQQSGSASCDGGELEPLQTEESYDTTTRTSHTATDDTVMGSLQGDFHLAAAGSNSYSASESTEINQNLDNNDWCTETLIVPTPDADTIDLFPAETSPLFHTNAHLSFLGEDEQDCVVGEDTEVAVAASGDDEGQQMSSQSDSVFHVSEAAPLPSDVIAAEPVLSTPDHTPVSDGLAGSKMSTSSCATDTDHSAESLVTVIYASACDKSTSPNVSSLEPSISASSSVDKHLSVLMDSVVTSSTDSNERSVATVLDGAEEENQPEDEETDEQATGGMSHGQDQCANQEYDFRLQEEHLEAMSCVDVLTRASSQLELLTLGASQSRDETEPIDTSPAGGTETSEDKPGDDVEDGVGESIFPNGFESNIEESFVRLARSDSGNEQGCAESNEGSGHSPTQGQTCGKSSEEASADELIDDGEAATTCSDVEIISTPPYDTVSERSSRSGIVSRTAIDWSFHPPKPFRNKDNGARKHGHGRAGSDQSLASLESIPAGSFAATGISRSASFSVQDFEKRVAHLTDLVEARERKLLDIAKENAQLADENEQLRNELQQLHSRISRDSNVDVAQRELSERLHSIERKYDSLCRERDALKRKCDNLEREVASRVTPQPMKEKEELIAELMAEGEKLSKQELKQGNIIKKLREKEKELEKQFDSAKSKLKDMDELRQKLKEKDEQEIKYDEMVHELQGTVSRNEKTMSKLRSELEDARDKSSSYKSTLENCAKELAELNQEKATKEAEIARLMAKAAESKENELQKLFDDAQLQWQSERQSLIRESQCLRASAVQDAEDYQQREQSMRSEVTRLRQKVQETEERNQELAETITTATKPLLRQLESMQLSFRTQQANWERVEKSLYDRISEAEKTATSATEKERESQMNAMEMRKRVEQAEKQATMLAKEKTKLEGLLTTAQKDNENVDRIQAKYTQDLQSHKNLHQQALEALNKDKELIIAQFDYEKRQMKSQFEANLAELTEKLNEKERLIVSLRQQMTSYQDSLQRSLPTASAPLSQPLSLRISSESPNHPQGEKLSRTQSIASVQEDQNQSAYDSWPNDAAGGGFAILLEKLRTRLQQREGELSIAKDELRSIQQHRDALAVQLIALSNSKSELEQRLEELESIRQQYTELDGKYQGLLLLYGEQIERNEELQMDLQDVKAVYKEQLDALLQRPTT